MNTQKNENTVKKTGPDWLRNLAIGLLLFISGILSKFFPATIMSVTYIVSAVVLALIGISDGVCALKYKETGSDWKLVLIMGAVSVLAAVYFIPAVIYLYSINISIYVVCAWLILRGALNIAGLVKGTLRRKNVLLWAVVMIASGTFCAFFCEKIVSYSTSYLAYILIAAGVVLSFYGIYQKTDEKERKEKEFREEAVRKGFEEAVIPAKQSELIPEPSADTPAESEELPEVTEAPAEPSEEKHAEGEATNAAAPGEAAEVIEVEAEELKESPQKKKGLFDSLFKK